MIRAPEARHSCSPQRCAATTDCRGTLLDHSSENFPSLSAYLANAHPLVHHFRRHPKFHATRFPSTLLALQPGRAHLDDGPDGGLKQDFLPEDLQRLLANIHFDGCIAVQARQNLEETRWLLELAEKHAFIKGVVGWVDLRSETVSQAIGEICPASKARGRPPRSTRRTGRPLYAAAGVSLRHRPAA